MDEISAELRESPIWAVAYLRTTPAELETSCQLKFERLVDDLGPLIFCSVSLSGADVLLKRYEEEKPENELGVFMKLYADYTPLMRELLETLNLDDRAVVWKSTDLPFSER
ncbi:MULTISPECIES: hypothetical protein [Hydrocarboniphaga]|uniref:hypothetical protein n=1 Tax=Hydrocarboniphaga TaxID=243627 RepID=UPI0005913F9F|nr:MULTISPECIES: hypothetical protein [Hydrocarboniphaga]MDZ4080035.1 hypothetical protein [Hydrocarboniphaga sp.]